MGFQTNPGTLEPRPTHYSTYVHSVSTRTGRVDLDTASAWKLHTFHTVYTPSSILAGCPESWTDWWEADSGAFLTVYFKAIMRRLQSRLLVS